MNNILLVDDDLDTLFLIKHILEQEGTTVHCAVCGEEALSLIENGNFSLMITDLNMPGLNGLELARKALEFDPSMPTVMITSDMTLDILRLAADVGINKILAKPLHSDEILKTVREIVRM